MKLLNKIAIILSLITTNTIYAEDLSVDDLLKDIATKTDLSEKTKLENGGISYIYTRDDIQKMQAHNLKDILKSTYPFGYNENNFGISDPYSLNKAIPYMSSSIKIYIDNQEITSGLYGSGLILYGNMDIDFVDHIEVYSGNPTFAFSVEPGFTIIKLYSKVAQKDEGSKIVSTLGSYGKKGLNAYTTDFLENDWSYFSYINLIDDKRRKYYNDNSTLSRDSKIKHFVGTLTKENQHILLDAISKNADSFIDSSISATPKEATIDTQYLHIGYDTVFEYLSFLISYDQYDTQSFFEDNNRDILQTNNLLFSTKTDSKSEVYTTGLKYNINIYNNNILMGGKYRLKHFVYDTLQFNYVDVPKHDHTQQTTSTIFFEDQYKNYNNSILTSGISYSQVRNNNSVQDDDLFSYRLGYTYTTNKIVSKTVASHLEVSLDPFLINSIYLENSTSKIATTKTNLILQNIKYKNNSNMYEILASYMDVKDSLVPNTTTGLLQNSEKNLIITSALTRYIKRYNSYNKFEITVGMNKIEHLPSIPVVYEYSSTIKNFCSYKRFDIFNELLFYTNDNTKTNYYDYTFAIKYHKTDDLSFGLKATNILDKAPETNYSVVNLETLQPTTPLMISPIDRAIMLTMEYTF